MPPCCGRLSLNALVNSQNHMTAPLSSQTTFRHYREQHSRQAGEVSFQVVVGETDLWVAAEEDLSRELSLLAAKLRGEIQAYMALDPSFRTSLVPIDILPSAPDIVRRMAAGARLAGVGPFAAVAGTIAQLVAEHFKARSPEMLVENGGDIYIQGRRERIIGLLPEVNSKAMFGLRIAGGALPLAICSSSASIGHSLSFGHGELATVLAVDGAFSDAAATALCNMLQTAEDIPVVVKQAQAWAKYGLKGVFVQCGDRLGMWGDFELVSL